MDALWSTANTPDGRTYYFNKITKATQWTKPVELMAPAEVIVHPHFSKYELTITSKP